MAKLSVVADDNDPMDGHIAKRGLAFVNPKLSTRAAERRRKLARIVRHVAVAIAAVMAAIVFCVTRTLGPLGLALTRWADKLDKDAKRRQQKAARRVLNTWGVQESTASTRTPPARSA